MNVTVMNIGLFLAIVIFLISLFIKNKKIPKKSYVIIYIVNIIILCVVLGNYFYNTPSGAGSIVIPIFYILVILYHLHLIIRALRNNYLK
ncbi:hypothetical protein AYJ08_01565 [Brevibacillus sp. SKDU10]|nr:hypothetical protein AYJ08_01565 [Brevibacillus sp. SKDU10]